MAMRILWLCNKVLSEHDSGTTGTWLDAMAQALTRSGEVELGNIAQGKVARCTRKDCGTIRQWVIPSRPIGRDGLPPKSVIAEISQAIDEFAPDLVHIWGTESYWGLLTARGLIRVPALLEMQGLKGAIARVFAGGLTWEEQLRCIGPKEIIKRSTVFRQRKQFARWGRFEQEIIRGHQWITTQSDWIRAWVKSINPGCQFFHNDLALNSAFYSDFWRLPVTDQKIIFCSAAYPVPYKGLHVAIRAIAVLKRRLTNIKLHIAGAHQRQGLRQEGYVAWLNRQVKELGVQDEVVWLGALTASQIVEQMRLASAMVLPTFIENCSTAMQEAMMFGIPLVVSYVGGLPSLARDKESALFFPAGDAEMCAYQLERLLTDRALAERIGKGAREIALDRNDPERIVRNQIDIYSNIIESVPNQ
jgi:glycosyltransferase involved in cell wall biosynthesis